MPNQQSAWKFYALDSARIITRDAFTELPTPDIVIHHMDRLFVADSGMQAETDLNHADVDALDGNRNDISPPGTLAGVTAAGFEALEINPDTIESENDTPANVAPPREILENAVESPEVENYNDGHRRSARIAGEHVPTVFNTKLDEDGEPVQLSAKKAVEQWGDSAKDAIRAEFVQLGDMGVLEAINPNEKLPRPPLPCSMFVRRKRNKKFKGRFVAGGHRQKRSDFLDRSAPTVGIENVFLLLAAASCALLFGYSLIQWEIATMDVTGAFLEVPLIPEEQEVLKLSPYLTELLRQSGLFQNAPLDDQKRITVRCLKALYGLVVSAKRFYDHISKVFIDIGLKCCRNDPCIFFGIVGGHFIYLCIHVDDLLVISDTSGLDIIANCLRKRYREVKITLGDVHDYLGMVISRTTLGVTVQMYAYVDKCIAQYEDVKEYKMPASLTDFFVVVDILPLLDDESRIKFHSTVAMLLYLAKRVRCDILLAGWTSIDSKYR